MSKHLTPTLATPTLATTGSRLWICERRLTTAEHPYFFPTNGKCVTEVVHQFPDAATAAQLLTKFRQIPAHLLPPS